MSDMNRSFAGSMPEFYDRILVPVMFEPFARDLAARFGDMQAGEVLEIAAGTGIVTRALAHCLPPAVRITATDLNPAMLAQAKSHAGLERVQWREADALALPFGDRLFDRALCQFGVMFFPDKEAAFREVLRVLRPGGRFLFNVWGEREGSVWEVVTQAVGACLSRDPASLVSPPYDDAAAVMADLAAAGFVSTAVETVTKITHSASARAAAVSICHGGLVRAAIEAHAPGRLDDITDAAAKAVADRYGDGPIASPLQALLFTAARPAA